MEGEIIMDEKQNIKMICALIIAFMFVIPTGATLFSGEAYSPEAAVVEEQIDTIIIQPDATVGKDTWIRSISVNDNYGTNNLMPIGNAGESFVGLIQFELPSNNLVVLQQATLSMYNQRASAGVDVSVHGVSVAWEEGEQNFGVDASNWTYNTDATTWTTPGGDYYPMDSSFVQVSTADTWYSWNVTNIVGSWMNGTWDNNGFLLRTDFNDWVQFWSSDSTDASLKPKLTLTYSAEIDPPVPPQTFTEDDPARNIDLTGRGNGTIVNIAPAMNATSNFPFRGAGYDMEHAQWLYKPEMVGGEGVIRSISLKSYGATDPGVFMKFNISMAHTDLTDLTDVYADNYKGYLTEVFPTQTIHVNSSNNDDWLRFDLNGNFTYDSSHNLLIDMGWFGDDGKDYSTDIAINMPYTSVVYDNT